MKKPLAPLCQSCGMPMEEPKLFGTLEDGSLSEEYCIYCYKDGAFTNPSATLEEMIGLCTKIMTEHKIMPEKQARAHLETLLPTLGRWQ